MDSLDIWKAKILDSTCQSLSERRPAKTSTAHAGNIGATDPKTCSAARRHVLYRKGENIMLIHGDHVLFCGGVVEPEQVDVVRRCERCSDHVWCLLGAHLAFDASGELLSYETDVNCSAAAFLPLTQLWTQLILHLNLTLLLTFLTIYMCMQLIQKHTLLPHTVREAKTHWLPVFPSALAFSSPPPPAFPNRN